MGWIVEPERRIPVTATADVLVCGGGFAGVCAAIAAARLGAKVLLIERYGFLGGLATAALVITTPPLNNGLNIEIARRLAAWGSFPIETKPGGDAGSDDMVGVNRLVPYDPETLKIEFVRMLEERGVELLFHTLIVDVLMEGGNLIGVVVENKAGRQAVKAGIVIDASGEADVAARAGAPCRVVDKPITLMFTLADVDRTKALAHLGTWNGLKKVVTEAARRGALPFDLAIDPDFGAPGIFAADLVHDGGLAVWGGMLYAENSLDPTVRTRAETVTRDHAFRFARFLKDTVPGFEGARLEQTATETGIRATRIVDGVASPSREAVLKGRFADIAVRPYAGCAMALPYGSLLPKGIGNLLVAGRCLSADEAVMGRLRLIPVCGASGETAGTAAALALKTGVAPAALNVALLQKTLTEQGVKLEGAEA